MLKKLIVYAIPFLIPFLLFVLYWLLARKGALPGPRSQLWLWLSVAGICLILLTAGVLAVTSGADPGSSYTPPRVEDGVLKDGEFREDK